MVTFEEALKLARKLNLFSMIETSSKESQRMDMIEDFNDIFSMCALNCYDISIEKQRAKLGISPVKKNMNKSNMGKSNKT